MHEASAIGHALTLRRPLRLEHDRATDVYAVDGTPTDCVNIAIAQVFSGLPDLVVSGINKGWNLGDDVTYSGTVAGALEGALLGIPAIAVSLRARRAATYDFAAGGARRRPTLAERAAAAAAAAADVPQRQRAEGRAAGASRHGAGQAEPHHVGRSSAHDPQGAAVLLDRGRAGRLGAARPVGLPGGARRLRLGDAAPAGPDRRTRRWRRSEELSRSWRLGEPRAAGKITLGCRGVAQPGRALGSGPRGRRFESSRPDQFNPAVDPMKMALETGPFLLRSDRVGRSSASLRSSDPEAPAMMKRTF